MSLSKTSTPRRALLALPATVLQLPAMGPAHAGDDLMQRQRDLLAGSATSEATLGDQHHVARAERFDVDAQQSARQVIAAVANMADPLPVLRLTNGPPFVSGDAQALARNVLRRAEFALTTGS